MLFTVMLDGSLYPRFPFVVSNADIKSGTGFLFSLKTASFFVLIFGKDGE